MLDERVQRTEITEEDWILGPPTAPVTMLEYGDFECPHCAMARPVLEGLVAAHTVGVLHRDIKPGNLLVGDDDHVRIVDFGLASATHSTRWSNEAAHARGRIR